MDDLVPYHWILTLQYLAGDGTVAAHTETGKADLRPGSSRNDAFERCLQYTREQIAAKFGALPDRPVVVLFHSLDLDTLGADQGRRRWGLPRRNWGRPGRPGGQSQDSGDQAR
jgi:hypothetical protein